MYIKLSFFDVMSEVQKDLEDVSAGKGVFFPRHSLLVFASSQQGKPNTSTLLRFNLSAREISLLVGRIWPTQNLK
jgi:hypothetical protein